MTEREPKKRCACCGSVCPIDDATCPNCGEASWVGFIELGPAGFAAGISGVTAEPDRDNEPASLFESPTKKKGKR